MEFCERCGGVIIIKEDKAFCASCNHRMKKKPKIESSEIMEKKETVAVINENEEYIYPIIEADCPNCKNKKAYFWTTQTRSSDEAETKFYKCVKCKHAWRKYR
ncbi:MAG: transcription factor S [Nanoarchaeota archaeon]